VALAVHIAPLILLLLLEIQEMQDHQEILD
jgi:hypothetical protein